MLQIFIHNDGSGNKDVGNYDYVVKINNEVVDMGRILKNRRGDWRRLVIQWGHELQKEMDKECADRFISYMTTGECD